MRKLIATLSFSFAMLTAVVAAGLALAGVPCPPGSSAPDCAAPETSSALTPSVTGISVSSAPASGDTYRLGETIRVTVSFSGTVTLDGSASTPALYIDMDPAHWGIKRAVYESGSGTSVLTFVHTVTNPNFSSQGIAVVANSLRLNGATLSHDGLGHDAGHKVNWEPAPAGPRGAGKAGDGVHADGVVPRGAGGA